MYVLLLHQLSAVLNIIVMLVVHLTQAHLRGHAVDIKIESSSNAMKILKALLEVGFNRIGYNSRTKFFSRR